MICSTYAQEGYDTRRVQRDSLRQKERKKIENKRTLSQVTLLCAVSSNVYTCGTAMRYRRSFSFDFAVSSVALSTVSNLVCSIIHASTHAFHVAAPQLLPTAPHRDWR